MPTQHSHTFASRYKPTLKPKLAKECVCPTQEEFENFFSTPSNKIKSPNRTVLTRTDIALNVNRLVGQVCADNGQTLFHCEKSGDTHNKGLNESGGSVLRRHICARWKFSSPNEGWRKNSPP